ncbi:hypothetical protein [Halobacteriaceae bacterium SHR40]|uniref:hypothetical protein n=1 Tax=Halovenus amylolytica TaxID=2500550 RepID=UPI000FE33F5C
MEIDRRQYLLGLGGVGTVSLAGCSNGGGGDDETTSDEPDEEVYEGLRIDGEVMSPAFPVEFYERGTENRVAQIHWHGDGGEWHQAPLEIPTGSREQYDIWILDPDLDEIPSGEGTKFQFEIEPTEETPEGLLAVETSDGVATIEGLEKGAGELIVHILSDGEQIWRSPPLSFEVGTPE